jgi:hypothetical protein
VNPRYCSSVSDDQAPFEFSIALSNGPPEVQVYVDVQSAEATLRRNTDRARALLEVVAPTVRASLARLRQVESLFFPDEPEGPFGMWIGASWDENKGIRLKAYLNPAVRGPERAHAVVGEALGRLGFERPWQKVGDVLAAGGRRRDEVGIVSLDLSSADEARVKLYVRHHHATVEDIDAVARLASDYRGDDVAAFYLAVAGGKGPFLEKPALTELAFTDRNSACPSSVTLEFPIGSYVETDEDAAQRIRHCLKVFGVASSAYDEAIRQFAIRPLGNGRGIHSHVTFRRIAAPGGGRPGLDRAAPPKRDSALPRIGIYLASEAYSSSRRAG